MNRALIFKNKPHQSFSLTNIHVAVLFCVYAHACNRASEDALREFPVHHYIHTNHRVEGLELSIIIQYNVLLYIILLR